MKKLLLSLSLVGGTSIALAQGTVNFSAGSAVATRIATNTPPSPSTGYIAPAGTATYYFGLFVAPTNVMVVTGLDPTLSGFTFTGLYGTNTALGRFSGNPSTDGTPVPGISPGAYANFVVAGWSGNLGPNWAAVQPYLVDPAHSDVWYGISAVAQSVQLGGGVIPEGGIFGTGAGQVPGFTLIAPLPEPSAAFLLALGTAALVLRRSQARASSRLR
jgi:hypothetical protein